MKPVFIYMLFDTFNKVPVYIGASIYPFSRMYAHKSTTLKEYEYNSEVKLIILEEVEEKNAGEREMFWYYKKKGEGYNLLQSGKRWYPTYQQNEIDFRIMANNPLFKKKRDLLFKNTRKLLRQTKNKLKTE